MSQENLEVVRSLFAEFKETHEAVRWATTPDFVWDMSNFRGWPDQPQTTGPDEFEAFFAAWSEPYEEWDMDVDELREVGDDRVLVLLTQRGRLPGSDSWVDLRVGQVVTVTGGLVSRFDVFGDRADAFNAAGLRE